MKSKKARFGGLILSRFREDLRAPVKVILLWVVYLLFYNAAQFVRPIEAYHPVYCGLDDLIPFAEIFIIPYCMWYFMILWSYFWFFAHSRESFRKFSLYLLICQFVGVLFFYLYPTIFLGRPDPIPRENVFTFVIRLIYRADNATNAFPSLHCAFAFAMASVWLKEPAASRKVKWFVGVSTVLICASTVFIKQHSVLDFLMSAGICLVIEILLYGKDYWLPKWRKKNP